MQSLSILHIAAENFAGVPYDFMEMHKAHGDYSRLISLHANPLGFPEDICMDYPIARSSFAKKYRQRSSLIAKTDSLDSSLYWKPRNPLEALYFKYQSYARSAGVFNIISELSLDSFDIIHFDGGLDFTRDSRFAQRWHAMNKPIVCCYYGSDLRSRGIIREMDAMADLSITSEFDHLSLHPGLEYVFYPYNPKELPSVSEDKDFSSVKIVHSPTNRQFKGTDLILSVIEKLQKSFSFEFILLENMTRDTVLSIKKECTISIDQVGGTFGGTGYGKAGIESMAMGIPTITNMSDDYAAWLPDNPFLIANTASQLETVLVSLIEDPDNCKRIGQQAKEWVHTYHSYQRVHQHLRSLYTSYGLTS